PRVHSRVGGRQRGNKAGGRAAGPAPAALSPLATLLRNQYTHWCSTGWESHPAMDSSPMVPGFPPGDWPSLGSVLSRTLGPRAPGVPPCIDLTPVDADARFILRTPPGQPGYLGVAHAGFEAQAVDRRNIMLNDVDPQRLADRRALLGSFDTFRRQVDAAGVAGGLAVHQRQAFQPLPS